MYFISLSIITDVTDVIPRIEIQCCRILDPHPLDCIINIIPYDVRANSRIKAPVCSNIHDDVIKWNHFPRYWPFVRGIHRSPVNSPHKGQWRGALMFTLICVRINGWVNNRKSGDLRRYRCHYDVIVMIRKPHDRGRMDQTASGKDIVQRYLNSSRLWGWLVNWILGVASDNNKA